ncbi:oxygenase MpaB family protein [Conexibacter woesei]|uniref:oxygenase MpaB family protein n=1 Tax=Conexibacter woesei TaxID=191495 RepID=UPI0004273F2C|nr:oxygenase MpaB family protein [Conexibacter woesei]
MPATPLGPDTLTWRYFGDARGLLFAVRAGVLQAMHPAIDAALRQHSDFFENPWNRLLRSAPPILGVVYDGPRAQDTGAWVRDQHKDIRGDTAGGASYHALNPDAFYWAHATFFESIITVQRLLGNPLSRYDQERLYDESIGWYELYGLTMRPVPADYAAFEVYWNDMLTDGLEPTEVAIGSFGPVGHLPAPFPWLEGPAWWVLKPLVARGPTWIARGTLPDQARDMLGLTWSTADDVALKSMLKSLQLSWPLVPEQFRWHPKAWRAIRREQRRAEAAAGATASGGERQAA